MISELPKPIAANIEHFTGRTWLLPALFRWCEESDERMFILIGGPGTGKSMIMAWLAGAGPMPTDTTAQAQLERIRSQVKATHFCIAASGTTDPKEAARQIANQLTRKVPGFDKALAATMGDQVQIAGEQHVGRVEKGGSVTGVYIANLNLGGLSEELSFNRILRDPLKRLYEDGYDEPMLLLVDALDEALTYSGGTNIVQLLAKLTDLPSKVRILATTRPDPRVLKCFREVTPFDLIADAPSDADDIRLYVDERLALSSPAMDHEKRDLLAKRISEAAKGIFLYAYMVLGDLLLRLPDVPDLETYPLPEGLSGLYHDFLNRELGRVEDRWYETFKPVLGLIAVAQGEGLTRMQLQQIIGKEVEQTIRICRQYLVGDLPEGPFRPFHRSFADFLLDDKKNVDYHIDGAIAHRQIADHYWRLRGNWSNCDDYGLASLAIHLFRSQQFEQLLGLISQEWMRARFNGDGYVYSGFVADVDLAWQVATTFTQQQAAPPILVRLHIARRLAQLQAANYCDDDLQVMVWLGHPEEAIAHVRLRADPHQRFFGILAIYHALAEKGSPSIVLLEEALQTSRTISNDCERIQAQCSLAVIMARMGNTQAYAILAQASKESRKLHDERNRVDAQYAVVLALAGASRFEEAVAAAQTIEDPGRQARAMREVTGALARVGRFDEVAACLLAIKEVAQKSAAVSDLAASLAREDTHAADARFDEAIKLAHSVTIEEDRVYALIAVLRALMQAGNRRASEISREAQQAIQLLQSPFSREVCLNALVETLADAGSFTEAQKVANATATERVPKTRHETQLALAIALTEFGRFEEALEIARTIDDYESCASGLRRVALAKAWSGDRQALVLLDEAREVIETREVFRAIGPLSKLAALLAQCDDNRAGALFQWAIDLSHSIPADRDYSESLLTLATALLDTGRLNEGEQVAAAIPNELVREDAKEVRVAALARAARFDEALMVARAIDRDVNKMIALSKVAVELARAGHFAGAHTVVLSVTDPFHRSLLLGELALVLAEADNPQGDATFMEAIRWASAIDDDTLAAMRRASAQSQIATNLARARRFDQAEEIIKQIGFPCEWAVATGELAVRLFQESGGDNQRAINWLRAMWQAANGLPGDWEKGQVLRVLTHTLARLDRFTDARTIMASIQDRIQREATQLDLAAELARAGRFADALVTVDFQELDALLETIIGWTPVFERVEPGLAFAVLREATNVAGWVRSDWRKVHDSLPITGT